MGIMENTKKITVKNCVKYIVFAGVTYAILKVIPTKQLSNIEIFSLVTVILLGIISLECLTVPHKNIQEKMTDVDKMFDLDMDVNIDFDSTSSNRELATDIGNNKDHSFPDKERKHKEHKHKENKHKENKHKENKHKEHKDKERKHKENKHKEHKHEEKQNEKGINIQEIKDELERKNGNVVSIEDKHDDNKSSETEKIDCHIEVAKMRREM